MTCEKRIIIKRIEEITTFVNVDEELGCGFAPEGAYDICYKEIHELEDRLAKLRGFKNRESEIAFYETLPMNVQASIFGW